MIEIYQFRDFIPPGEPVRICRTCDWAMDSVDGLLCKKKQTKAPGTCHQWKKAMGADAPEEVND